MHVTTRPTADPPTQEEAIKALRRYGFPEEQLRAWKFKYNGLRVRSVKRGLDCTLTFSQYLKLAKQVGINSPNEIGTANADYQMGRIGDAGNYELGNCRFITSKQNKEEKRANGGYSRQSATRTGWTKLTHDGIAAMAEKARLRTKKNSLGRRNQARKISKSFVVRDPLGKAYKGKNLKAFCEKHRLTRQLMSSVCAGKISNHKGWTGKYVQPKTEK